METPRIIYGNYERTSSGMVYVGKSTEQSKAGRINKRKNYFLSLIEEEVELSFRSQNCLNNSGIKLIGQLVQKSASELLNLKNFGRTSLRDIEEDLKAKDLSLDMTLNFFPWDGTAKGNELIQILCLHKPGGGFLIGNEAAKELEIDLRTKSIGKQKETIASTYKVFVGSSDVKF